MKLTLSETKLLKDSTTIIADLVTEVHFKVTPTAVELVAMDPANVAMVIFKLLSSAFTEYHVTTPTTISLNLNDLKAVLRRADPGEAPEPVIVGDITLDHEGRTVRVSGETVELTGREFDLLAFLLAHPGTVMSRERLLERVWGLSFPGGTRTVDVHVGQLRRKLDRPDLIRTVRGSGYKAAA